MTESVDDVISDSDPDEINLYRIWHILVARKLVIAFVVGAFLVVAIAYSAITPNVYRASVSLIPTDTSSGSPLGNLGDIAGLASFAGFNLSGDEPAKQEALAVLRSRAFTTQFIRENDLLPVLFPDDWDATAREWMVPEADRPTMNDAFNLFDRKIRRVTEHNNGLITVSIDWTDPYVAAEWANGLVRRLNREMQARAIQSAEESLAYLYGEQEKTNILAVEQAVFRLIEAQIRQIMLANVTEEFAFRVIDPAIPPDHDDQSRPRRALVIVMMSLVGLLAALALALFLDLLERHRTLAVSSTNEHSDT